MNLRTPGPTPLPPEVLAAVGQQMINHRGPEFAALFHEITEAFKVFHETHHDLYLLTASGTGGMEAAVVNTLSPGDRVLAVSVGVFGDRWAEIAEAYGAAVTRLRGRLGSAARPDAVAAALRDKGPFRAVLITQNETSSGVTNPMEALCASIHEADPDALVLVDGISGLGAIRLQTDAWGCDVVVSASQKAWMAPPGLSTVSFSPRAWDAYAHAHMPRYYFDLGLARRYALRGQTPATPALPVMYALGVSLRQMLAEGREATVARHARIGAHCRRRATELGLALFAEPGFESNSVTAVTLPSGADADAVIEAMRVRHGVVVASGRDPGVDMIRIGHMGYVTETDLDDLFAALRDVLTDPSLNPSARR
jgi:aspartate aminotransferase-like enzyme